MTDIPFGFIIVPACYSFDLEELLPPSEEPLRPPPLEASPPFLETSFLVASLAEAKPLLEDPPREEPELPSLLREDDLLPLSEERPPSSFLFLLF